MQRVGTERATPRDAMRGHRTLFGSEAEVEAAWRVVPPILNAVEPLYEYDCGTWEPAEAEMIAAHIGGWIEPSIPGSVNPKV